MSVAGLPSASFRDLGPAQRLVRRVSTKATGRLASALLSPTIAMTLSAHAVLVSPAPRSCVCDVAETRGQLLPCGSYTGLAWTLTGILIEQAGRPQPSCPPPAARSACEQTQHSRRLPAAVRAAADEARIKYADKLSSEEIQGWADNGPTTPLLVRC